MLSESEGESQVVCICATTLTEFVSPGIRDEIIVTAECLACHDENKTMFGGRGRLETCEDLPLHPILPDD